MNTTGIRALAVSTMMTIAVHIIVYGLATENANANEVGLGPCGNEVEQAAKGKYEQMAEDTSALLKQLKIKDADFLGYSMGGIVALGIAIRHPELVRKLAVLGSNVGGLKEVFEPESYRQFMSLNADFAPAVLKEPYDRMAPDPKRWPILVEKILKMGRDFKGYTAAECKSIKAQVLIMLGDHDGVRPEHAVEMFRLIPNAQLAIFPGGDHFILFISPDRVLSTLAPFLDGPMPEQKKVSG
jgi:pimeloyl-ACP methyl ester carboxylesterase